MRRTILAVALLATLVAVGHALAASAKTVKVTETDFRIKLASATLVHGAYVFHIVNTGKVNHDLVIRLGKKIVATSPLIAPGASANLSARLAAGKYTFYCSFDHHLQKGMVTTVRVS